MSDKKRELPPLPPFTLEEAEQWMLRLEEIATTERDLGEATRHILGNLLLVLHRSKFIDAPEFLRWIQTGIPGIEEANVRIAVEVLTTALLAGLNEQTLAGTDPIRGTSVH
ncbi:MAG: hypothetical protein ACOY3Z_06290 [Thermodesulfobacteriota bacterium]